MTQLKNILAQIKQNWAKNEEIIDTIYIQDLDKEIKVSTLIAEVTLIGKKYVASYNRNGQASCKGAELTNNTKTNISEDDMLAYAIAWAFIKDLQKEAFNECINTVHCSLDYIKKMDSNTCKTGKDCNIIRKRLEETLAALKEPVESLAAENNIWALQLLNLNKEKTRVERMIDNIISEMYDEWIMDSYLQPWSGCEDIDHIEEDYDITEEEIKAYMSENYDQSDYSLEDGYLSIRFASIKDYISEVVVDLYGKKECDEEDEEHNEGDWYCYDLSKILKEGWTKEEVEEAIKSNEWIEVQEWDIDDNTVYARFD